MIISISGLAYIFWMISRGIFSPSIGEMNFFASVRGILILTPLALLCALVASTRPKLSAIIITLLGTIAILHFVTITLSDNIFDSRVAFRSLSADPDKSNYQSTSFYFGLSCVYLMVIAALNRGFPKLLSIAGAILVVILMGLVGARSSIVALAISAASIIIITRKFKLLQAILIACTFLTIMALLASHVGLIDFEELITQIVVIDRFVLLTTEEDSSERERLFTSALGMWLDNPVHFIIGGGLASFPRFIGEAADEGWYPHNFILESLAEGGIVAGLLLVTTGLRLAVKLITYTSDTLSITNVYLGALAVYAVSAFQFMGGLESLWIPTFFVGIFLLSNFQTEYESS
jgi:hypothetical protein